MQPPPGLDPELTPILAFELARGNAVARVDAPAGTRCPLAVALARPLDREGIEASLQLPPAVVAWESRDLHYPVEAGYASESSGHSIAGPIGPTP